jgi:hypothetical protein
MLLDNTGLNYAFRNLDFSMEFVFLSGKNAARCVLAASWVGRELHTFDKKNYYSTSGLYQPLPL